MSETPKCLSGSVHNFQPKRHTSLPVVMESSVGNTDDISELYCVNCGQVILLTGREQDSKVTPVRST